MSRYVSRMYSMLAALFFVIAMAASVVAAHPVQAAAPPGDGSLDINTMTRMEYAGAVSMAKEGMRLVYGDMSAADEARFEAEWLPLFAHPDRAVIEYLNRLNPLLTRFFAIRDSLNEALASQQAVHFELAVAADENDDPLMRELLMADHITALSIARLNRQLGQVVDRIVALGDLPKAEEARQSARKRHQEALQLLAPAKAGDGQWVLVDRKVVAQHAADHVNRKPSRMERGENGQMVKLSAEAIEARLLYSRQRVDFQAGRATLGFVNNDTSQGWQVDLAWQEPPLRLFPGETLNLRVGARMALLAKATASPKGKAIKANGAIRATAFRTLNSIKWPEDSSIWRAGEGAADVIVDGQTRELERWLALRTTTAEGMVGEPGTQAFEAPEPHRNDPSPPYAAIDPSGQSMLVDVMGLIEYRESDHQIKQPRENYFRVRYIYQWDPDGASFTAWAGDDGGQNIAGAKAAPAKAGAQPAANDEAEVTESARLAQRTFHQANIKYFEHNLRSLEERLRQTSDPQARDAMVRDILCQKSAIQREKDAIASAQSGRFVRTRTELDALNMKIMLEESLKAADDVGDMQRLMERAPRLIRLAKPEDQRELTEFFYRNASGGPDSPLTTEKARALMRTLGNRIGGELAQQAATNELAAIDAAERLERAENVKTFADGYLMVLSVAAPVYHAYAAPNLIAAGMRAKQMSRLYTLYQGTTGYIEGGPAKAFSAVASSYNTVTTLANAAMEGYQSGVLQHLDEYAKNPTTTTLDEGSAGMYGAVWNVGKEAVKGYVLKKTVGALMPTQAGTAPVRQSPTIAQQINQAHFQSRQANGRAKVKLFQQRAARLADAGRAGTPQEEVLRLREHMGEVYTAVKGDYFAKMHLKALQRAGDAKTVHYYNSMERQYRGRLTAEVERRMTAAGFSPQRYKTFSNSASRGSVGMDLDFGVEEPPRTVLQSGRRVPNPEHVAWRRTITQRLPDGTVVRRSPYELQVVGNDALQAAYQEIYGRPAGEAMIEFTSSYHPEAYRDLSWLGDKGIKTALVYATDPAWVQQAADVTTFKVHHMPKANPSLGHYGLMQERMRGLAKDFETKVDPMITGSKRQNPVAVKHLRELHSVFQRFGQDEIGPLEAERRVRELTGGLGIEEAADQFSVMMRGLRNTIRR